VKDLLNGLKNSVNRRWFMKTGVAAGAATMSAGLLANSSSVLAQEQGPEEGSGSLTAGDAAILRFLACLLYTSPSPRDLSTSRMPSSA